MKQTMQYYASRGIATLLLIMVAALMPQPASADGTRQPSGNGTAASPYLIGDADELYWFAEQVNSGETGIWGKLIKDIVVNKDVLDDKGELNGDGAGFRVWTPIGNGSGSYAGTFDGQGHTISGLYLNDGGRDFVGLFGLAYNANIDNVGVINSYFRGNQYVGGVCGNGSGSIITKCHNAGTVKGYYFVGGVCGNGGAIVGCHNTGEVSGYTYIGGVCGYDGTIFNCYNTGTVSGTGVGNQIIGGVLGTQGTIISSYNTGTVTGDEDTGGVCGVVTNTITNCYYLNTSCPQGIGTGSGEATAKTEDQFKSGEVAWLLNDSTAAGDVAWRQTLGSDNFPVLDTTHKL
ncbi:MAG: hypothetical protein HUK00_05635, partial [Bacteroidaceae bacterium]|nr:hypothetical protein [Bacteroidaceae bacterium]